MQKRITLIVFGMACFASSMTAQVSYNHDAAKMNQITVQEIGVGGLTPSLYYDAFHNSYQKTAASKNKLSFRTLAGISAYQQIEDAEKIDSALTKRAEIEALNIADRTGGALDLAWAAEGLNRHEFARSVVLTNLNHSTRKHRIDTFVSSRKVNAVVHHPFVIDWMHPHPET